MTWSRIRMEVERRIAEGLWRPGDLIPGEQALAREFGCARATVNRALRELATKGLLDRRRKAGTRVALHPVRKATFDIPIVRREIENRDAVANHVTLLCDCEVAPPTVATAMRVEASETLLHIKTLYRADNRPYAFEDRWIDPRTVEGIRNADLDAISANEWLVLNAPLTTGEIAFSAEAADSDTAAHLECAINSALFVLERTTFLNARAVTTVRLYFRPGYRMIATL